MQDRWFYGLHVYPTINTTNEDYNKIKASLETIYQNIIYNKNFSLLRQEMKENEHIYFAFVISLPYCVSVDLNKKDIQFGIYNHKRKEIGQECSIVIFNKNWDKNILLDIRRIDNKINSFLKGNKKCLYPEMEQAWNIYKDKQKVKNQNISNEDKEWAK